MTDQQETMFDEPAEFAPAYEEEASYEAAEAEAEEFPYETAIVAEPAPPEPPPAVEGAEPAAETMQAYEPQESDPPTPVASLPILTADDFAALEERVLRAVSLVRREREGRLAAEERSVVLEGRIAGLQAEVIAAERLREEIVSLRAEREQVRQRIERLLGQLDALDF
jgi:hypothetical protein